MRSIQEQFDAGKSAEFALPIGEYEGPLVIRRTCNVDGHGSTLWVKDGPALLIEAPNVTIKNLRVEVTGSSEKAEGRVAIKTIPASTSLANVEVAGDVVGFANEPVNWQLPAILSLGNFAAERDNTFVLSIEAAADAKLKTTLHGTSIQPETLVRGKNAVLLQIGRMRDNTILYGEILVKSLVTRRIYITGKALAGAPEHHDSLPAVQLQPAPQAVPVVPPAPPVVVPPVSSSISVRQVERGQRLSIGKMQGKNMEIVYEHQGVKKPVDIDAYVFLLQTNGKVRSERDLIFWGNEAGSQAIRLRAVNGCPSIQIEPAKLEPWLEKVSVCYSIYGDDPGQAFYLISGPRIRIFIGEQEFCRFELKELNMEKTIVGLEIYRHNGEWRMNFVGSGYRAGLKQLCESFGVEVK